MMNRVILVGRITKDPELKKTAQDIAVVNFTIAVNRNYTDQQGEKQADFISCVVWRRQAENVAKYVSKGMLLGVEGRIQTRQYESETGMKYITEVLCDSVQFLENKSSNQSFEDQPSTKSQSDEFYETSKKLAAEDDLPF
ncbi:MAG: single-stranded DNA-binding protein [Acholeplasmataceae bacterium]|jgi:single-strand DNA-binding protein